MKVKELVELLEEYKDEDLEVRVEYTGYHDLELSKGECCNVDDINISNVAVYLEFK